MIEEMTLRRDMEETLTVAEKEFIERLKKLGTPGKLLDACIKDACTRLIPPEKGKPEHMLISYYSWPQIWRKVSFNENLEMVDSIQGGRIILAPTVIVESNLKFDICVYHAGEFSYYIKNPNDLFVKDLTDRKLMSAEEYYRRSKPYDSIISDRRLLQEAVSRMIN